MEKITEKPVVKYPRQPSKSESGVWEGRKEGVTGGSQPEGGTHT